MAQEPAKRAKPAKRLGRLVCSPDFFVSGAVVVSFYLVRAEALTPSGPGTCNGAGTRHASEVEGPA